MELIARDLVKVYGSRTTVYKLSLNLMQGEIVGLLGPNGAGKTTSFYMIAGLVQPTSGKILLNSVDITKVPLYKRAQLGIGYLPQESSVFKDLTVEENILAPLELKNIPKRNRLYILESLLNEFSIQHIRNNLGKVLSGGERRRVEIARLLTINPRFILLDEPFAGVDPIAVGDIQQLIFSLKNKNIGVLITDHNVDETLSITDRAYIMFKGQLLKSGTPEELVNDEQVRSVYLGNNFAWKN